GKLALNIYLLTLKTINLALLKREWKIAPNKCLFFEDSMLSIESKRRVSIKVI
ncbi:hypothetical protein QBC46DRAFT_274837, partial [Diplogelasinospora grovesii]